MLSSISRNILRVSKLTTNNYKFVLSKMSTNTTFETLSVSIPKEFVYHVKLNRPEKRNAMTPTMRREIKQCFEELSDDADCRVVIVSGEGKIFTAGIDLSNFMEMGKAIADAEDAARKAKILYKEIITFQQSISSLEHCRKPVLSAVHSACVGAGVDLIVAADMRYCTKDAWFQVKEVDVGLTADVGTLQRLPKVIGSSSLARELCFTGRKMNADEALTCGLVSRVYGTRDEMIEDVTKIAEEIAKKSPVAVQGTKMSLVHSRDHTVQEGLDHVALLNQLNMQSEDLLNAAMAQISKDDNVKFSKL